MYERKHDYAIFVFWGFTSLTNRVVSSFTHFPVNNITKFCYMAESNSLTHTHVSIIVTYPTFSFSIRLWIDAWAHSKWMNEWMNEWSLCPAVLKHGWAAHIWWFCWIVHIGFHGLSGWGQLIRSLPWPHSTAWLLYQGILQLGYYSITLSMLLMSTSALKV